MSVVKDMVMSERPVQPEVRFKRWSVKNAIVEEVEKEERYRWATSDDKRPLLPDNTEYEPWGPAALAVFVRGCIP